MTEFQPSFDPIDLISTSFLLVPTRPAPSPPVHLFSQQPPRRSRISSRRRIPKVYIKAPALGILREEEEEQQSFQHRNGSATSCSSMSPQDLIASQPEMFSSFNGDTPAIPTSTARGGKIVTSFLSGLLSDLLAEADFPLPPSTIPCALSFASNTSAEQNGSSSFMNCGWWSDEEDEVEDANETDDEADNVLLRTPPPSSPAPSSPRSKSLPRHSHNQISQSILGGSRYSNISCDSTTLSHSTPPKQRSPGPPRSFSSLSSSIPSDSHSHSPSFGVESPSPSSNNTIPVLSCSSLFPHSSPTRHPYAAAALPPRKSLNRSSQSASASLSVITGSRIDPASKLLPPSPAHHRCQASTSSRVDPFTPPPLPPMPCLRPASSASSRSSSSLSSFVSSSSSSESSSSSHSSWAGPSFSKPFCPPSSSFRETHPSTSSPRPKLSPTSSRSTPRSQSQSNCPSPSPHSKKPLPKRPSLPPIFRQQGSQDIGRAL